MLGSPATRTVALASIGSGSVTVGIARAQDETISIIASEYRALPLEVRAPAQTIAALKDQLRDAGTKLLARPEVAPEAKHIPEVHCILQAPWTHANIARATTQLEKEEHVSAAMIRSITEQARKAAGGSGEPLEASLAQVWLNGYPTASPVWKRAHHIELALLVSSADPAMRAAATESLQALFPVATIALHSSAGALLSMYKRAFPAGKDALILDVSEEGTEALVIERGTLVRDAYVPEGVRTMIERAMPGSAPEQTLATLRLMAHDQCSQESCAEVEAAFAKMEPDLVHAFGEFFSSMLSPQRLPSSLFLVAHPDLAPWLTRFFARIDFTQFTRTAQPFEISLLPEQEVSKGSNSTIVQSADLDLAIELINKDGA